MKELLTKVADFSGQLKRNIIDLNAVANFFDDILDGDEQSSTDAAESLVIETRKNMNFAKKLSDFYYTAAIYYPFEAEPLVATRYSDGSFPVWYGSLDMDTTIHETVHHMSKVIMDIDGVEDEGIVVRKRTVFNVNCTGLLIDTRNKKSIFPDLVSSDYSFCQSLGKRLSQSGYPGLLSPSARCAGINANVFTPKVLSNPKPYKDLTYKMDVRTGETAVLLKNKVLLTI